METLYILDDDKEFTDDVKQELEAKEFKKYKIFNKQDEFKKNITKNMFAAVIDFFMPGMNGMEVTELVKEVQPDALVVIVSESQYANLPLKINNYKYVKFVCKGDQDFIDQIITMTRNHFEMILQEMEFKKRVLT